MCEFVSYIQKGRKFYFLTGKQVFETPKGEALRKWCKSTDDYVGHGAIRWYYGLEQKDGRNVGCTDFSSPENFPTMIVRAIKRGDMQGLGTSEGLLTDAADAEYKRGTAPAYAEYKRVTAAAFWGLFANPENRVKAWR